MKEPATSRQFMRPFSRAVPVIAAVSMLSAISGANAASDHIALKLLPTDRATIWKPGMTAVGGIPTRATVCATVKPIGGTSDDTSRIQAAINVCPTGQVVQLTAGNFLINGGHYILINKGITLRGAGPGQTTLAKTDGAKPFQSDVGRKPSPLIVVGPALFSSTDNITDAKRSTNIIADAANGSYAVKVDSVTGFIAGQIVLLDEASGAEWLPDPQGRGQVWAAPDWRVVWQKHKPAVQFVDDFAPDAFPTTPQTAGSWFSRQDRPTAEIKQIASINGNTITFTTPFHISYRSSHAAQLSMYSRPLVMNAGVEDMTLTGGDAGNLRFNWAAESWAKNIENTVWHGEGFAIHSSFRIELREFYVHDAAWAQPGGGGYAISLSAGSSEVLIENGIAVRANKLIAARSAGAGSVVAYNYMDMSYINTQGSWIETGLNASHMVGPHHVLFEGNFGHNADSDNTHGNSVYLTFFRNQLRGVRAPFDNQAGGRIDDMTDSRNGPQRAAGLMAFSYWTSFVGNVLGSPGKMNGWVYETTFAGGKPGIWMLGWDAVSPYPTDAKVATTTIRHGNFDYLTNAVRWDPSIADHSLPDSLYLTKKPAFFNVGRGYKWPWVDAAGPIKLYELPAKVRYDAGTPFKQP